MATTETDSGSDAATEFLPGEIVDAVALASLNAVAMQPSTLANVLLGNLVQNTNQAQENEVSFQQTQNGIQATVVGKVVGMLTSLGPLASMSAQQLLTGNAVSEELAGLQASVAAFTQTPSGGGGGGASGPIIPGQPGSSGAKPITKGTLRIAPPAGVTMNVYIRSHTPGTLAPTNLPAPSYTVTSGDVYVYDGPEVVNIVFGSSGDGVVLGTVNVRVQSVAS